MSEKKGGNPLYGIGGVTLLTVLLVLCLTLFSVLALSSAQADKRLSEKNAEAVRAYYAADNLMLEMMKQIEGMWPSDGRRPIASDVAIRLVNHYNLEVETEGDGLFVHAEATVQETQTLIVELYLGPDGSGPRWEIRKWQIIPPEQDEGDIFNLPLFVP